MSSLSFPPISPRYRSIYGRYICRHIYSCCDFKDLPKTTIRDSNAAKDTRVVNYSGKIIQNKEYTDDVEKEKKAQRIEF